MAAAGEGQLPCPPTSSSEEQLAISFLLFTSMQQGHPNILGFASVRQGQACREAEHRHLCCPPAEMRLIQEIQGASHRNVPAGQGSCCRAGSCWQLPGCRCLIGYVPGEPLGWKLLQKQKSNPRNKTPHLEDFFLITAQTQLSLLQKVRKII